MAISCTKDGRYFVYWRETGRYGRSTVKKNYFGRGPDAEAKAKEYNENRNLLSVWQIFNSGDNLCLTSRKQERREPGPKQSDFFMVGMVGN